MRIGDEYQAVIPEFDPDIKPESNHDAMLVWAPKADLNEQKLDDYVTLAKEKYGYNAGGKLREKRGGWGRGVKSKGLKVGNPLKICKCLIIENERETKVECSNKREFGIKIEYVCVKENTLRWEGSQRLGGALSCFIPES